ncbi:MAG: hypothetical protein SwBeaMacB_13760 [Shewanella algae]|uniref:hypothetical protein n=1 Tax=Shewanella algae TaxID=38313 RepID=UPI0034B94AE5
MTAADLIIEPCLGGWIARYRDLSFQYHKQRFTIPVIRAGVDFDMLRCSSCNLTERKALNAIVKYCEAFNV